MISLEPNIQPLSFGRWLRARRRGFDLTQQELAERVGCATATIRKLESDERQPSKAMAYRLAECLGIEEGQFGGFAVFARGGELLSKPAGRRFVNIPPHLSSLIGREQEIIDICSNLRERSSRLLTLVGAPGVGKTRLAIECGTVLQSHFVDGVYFVDLTAIHEPTLLVRAISDALGCQGQTNKNLIDILKEFLCSRNLLLILDNFEHIMEAAPQVTMLLQAAPHLIILVTSRETLRLKPEHQYIISTLPVPDSSTYLSTDDILHNEAVRLFAQRAQQICPEFLITHDNSLAVAEICMQLDGLPLAIELAAARIRILPPQAMLERLSGRLNILTEGARDLPPRQRTLRAALEWSYDLLDECEKKLFARLAVFSGGWTLHSAEAVCDDLHMDVLRGLESLLDKSMICHTKTRTKEPRFTMLRTIQEYALERLESAGEINLLRSQHTEFMVKLAELAEAHLTAGSDQRVWFDLLDDESDNLWAAVSWALNQRTAETVVRIGSALCRYYGVRTPYSASNWMRQAIEIDSGMSPALRAKALRAYSYLLPGTSRLIPVLLEESLNLSRQINDLDSMAESIKGLGIYAMTNGDNARARALFEEALPLYRASGNQYAIGLVLVCFAIADMVDGTLEGTYDRLLEALSIWKDLHASAAIARAHCHLAQCDIWSGNYDSARQHLKEALRMADVLQVTLYIEVLSAQGTLDLLVGDSRRAKQSFLQALSIVSDVLTDTKERRLYAVEPILMLGGSEIESRPERAVRLLSAGRRLMEDHLPYEYAGDRAITTRFVEKVRATLDPAVFSTVWIEGQKMSLDTAVTYALDAATG